MEYFTEEYKRKGGKAITTPDGFRYFSNRKKTDCIYLKCVLFRNGCKGTAKMNTELNLVYLKSEHNALKSRCRKRASTSHGNLRYVFNDVTRSDPAAHRITLKNANL